MDNINFLSSGMLGDFIQSLFAVKNICEQRGCKANLYLSEGHGGDVWTFGAEKAYRDLAELVYHQPYINSFKLLDKEYDESFINLNMWREDAATNFAEDGEYSTCWSEMLSKKFNFKIGGEYKWLNAIVPDSRTAGKIVIHRSKHRWSGIKWQQILDSQQGKLIFVTTNEEEYALFNRTFTTHNTPLLLVETIAELTNAFAGASYFIGNQSAPFSIANALDVPRLGELEAGVWKFYKDETKYSNNISWYLGEEDKYFTNESIIKL